MYPLADLFVVVLPGLFFKLFHFTLLMRWLSVVYLSSKELLWTQEEREQHRGSIGDDFLLPASAV